MSPSQEPAPGPFLVASAHAGDFVWRAGGAMALAAARGVQLQRNAAPSLGLANSTMADAYMRLYPEVTGMLT
jgi:LmbE family N-acetylglucosaminyl deacetylase